MTIGSGSGVLAMETSGTTRGVCRPVTFPILVDRVVLSLHVYYLPLMLEFYTDQAPFLSF